MREGAPVAHREAAPATAAHGEKQRGATGQCARDAKGRALGQTARAKMATDLSEPFPRLRVRELRGEHLGHLGNRWTDRATI
eukprot:2598529-Pyramimonas_sp.AAC.1